MRLALTLILLLLAPSSLFAADGAALYKTHCAVCHGADGKKVSKVLKIEDLTSEVVQKKSDEELAAAIADGKGKMPGFKAKLSEEQIRALVGHLRELASSH